MSATLQSLTSEALRRRPKNCVKDDMRRKAVQKDADIRAWRAETRGPVAEIVRIALAATTQAAGRGAWDCIVDIAPTALQFNIASKFPRTDDPKSVAPTANDPVLRGFFFTSVPEGVLVAPDFVAANFALLLGALGVEVVACMKRRGLDAELKEGIVNFSKECVVDGGEGDRDSCDASLPLGVTAPCLVALSWRPPALAPRQPVKPALDSGLPARQGQGAASRQRSPRQAFDGTPRGVRLEFAQTMPLRSAPTLSIRNAAAAAGRSELATPRVAGSAVRSQSSRTRRSNTMPNLEALRRRLSEMPSQEEEAELWEELEGKKEEGEAFKFSCMDAFEETEKLLPIDGHHFDRGQRSKRSYLVKPNSALGSFSGGTFSNEPSPKNGHRDCIVDRTGVAPRSGRSVASAQNLRRFSPPPRGIKDSVLPRRQSSASSHRVAETSRRRHDGGTHGDATNGGACGYSPRSCMKLMFMAAANRQSPRRLGADAAAQTFFIGDRQTDLEEIYQANWSKDCSFSGDPKEARRDTRRM
eukprot:TRINITY_DN21749_c0_g1_i1.p1 TRINITY_DN21749_c0_g1~~TRINITY_DN21749_c0_g1_i1.p1  ORF type:complete len:566 (-),score=72.70 TRINITY_DN21749_c0_g1_i1:70-1653(-)